VQRSSTSSPSPRPCGNQLPPGDARGLRCVAGARQLLHYLHLLSPMRSAPLCRCGCPILLETV
jgi:hypothetical protein